MISRKRNHGLESPNVINFATKLKLDIEKHSKEKVCDDNVNPCDW